MNPLFTKVYSARYLKFQVEVYSAESFSLIRLPKLDLPGEDHQCCSVYLKEIIDVKELGWEDTVTREEAIEMFGDNAGHDSNRYIVGEYTGRERSSENLCPDTALDGFLEEELHIALSTIDEDEDLYKQLMALHLEDMLLKPTA